MKKRKECFPAYGKRAQRVEFALLLFEFVEHFAQSFLRSRMRVSDQTPAIYLGASSCK